MKQFFEYRHTVGLEETNVVGNVYFSHFVRWQGRCREAFLCQYTPGILADLDHGLKIFTVSCSCEYLTEITAFQEISVRLSLDEITQSQIAFSFDYVRMPDEQYVATGRQRVVCMRAESGAVVPTRVPDALRSALAPFAG